MIGVSSYLLINFWYTRVQANKSAILAFTMNRVGDMSLSIAFFTIFWVFGNLDFASVFSLAPYINENLITLIGLLLLLAAMGKSAQIGLHSWLPGSMEGKILPVKSITKMKLIILFFIILYFISLDFCNLDPSLLYLAAVPVSALPRNKKGQFEHREQEYVPLPQKLVDALIGELLGDGCLRRTKHGDRYGNANFAITLKEYDRIFYLWSVIYTHICTSTPIRLWPNPKTTGKTPTQCNFSTKSLVSLTRIHSEWYVLNEKTGKFTKIVPLSIWKTLTPIGLAHWIMGDGSWATDDQTLFLCTDCFTKEEVDLLVAVLERNFGLISGTNRRINKNKKVCWRIRLSGKKENIDLLRSLVKPYLIPMMFYKLGLTE